MPRQIITEKIPRLRQRQRADGTWRLWWEPSLAERAAGFENVTLDADRPTWSIRAARRLNSDVAKAMAGTVTGKGTGTGRPTTGGRSIEALIHDYRASRLYADLRPGTRRSYHTNLNAISRKWGAHMVADFSKPVMSKWYQSLRMSSGDDHARALIRMMSILFSHAELALGWRPENSNPCFRLKLKSPTMRNRVATWAEYDALIAAALELGMPAMACAIALATLTAQRQKDIIEAQLTAFRDLPAKGTQAAGSNQSTLVWELIRSKKENYGILPVHPEAAPLVRHAIALAQPGQITLITDHATGRAYQGDLFRKRWSSIRARAARTLPTLMNLQFRDLRRTFSVWARAGGVSKSDAADVLGNSAATNPTLGEVYMPPSYHTAARAVAAVQRPPEAATSTKPEKRKKA